MPPSSTTRPSASAAEAASCSGKGSAPAVLTETDSTGRFVSADTLRGAVARGALLETVELPHAPSASAISATPVAGPGPNAPDTARIISTRRQAKLKRRLEPAHPGRRAPLPAPRCGGIS